MPIKNSYNKLREIIGDKIEELTIIRVKIKLEKDKDNKFTKKVIPLKSWQNITKTNIDELKNHNGGIAVVFKPENDYKYGFIDIDGFKDDLDSDVNKEFKKDLFKLLKSNEELYKHSIVQKTQSGGYHFIFKHEEKEKINNAYMNRFKIPTKLKKKYKLKQDYFGFGKNSGAIEVFVNEPKLAIIYPTKITSNRSYEIICIGDEFGKPVKKLKEQLKKVFGDNEIVTEEYKSKEKIVKSNENSINSSQNDFNKKRCINKESIKKFKLDEKLKNELCEEVKKQTGNHNRFLGFLNSYLYEIGFEKKEIKEYIYTILNEANDLTDEHKSQISSYIKNLSEENYYNYNPYREVSSKELAKKMWYYKLKSHEFSFGHNVKAEDSYYVQDSKGIKYVKIVNTEKGENVKETRVANLIIENITIILDKLKLFEPVYNIEYKNLTFNKNVIRNYLTFDEAIKELESAQVFHKPFYNEFKQVLSSFIIDGANENIFDVKEIAYLKGFWLDEDKVISNTTISELEYNKDELAEAIGLLNSIMKSRSSEGKKNDASVENLELYLAWFFKILGYLKEL